MTNALGFDPVLPLPLIALAGLVGLAFIALMYWRGARSGAPWRLVALLLLIAGLMQPIWRAEDREPLNDVVTLVVDDSESQTLGDRQRRTAEALAALQDELDALDGLDVDLVRLGAVTARDPTQTTGGTHLIGPLREHLADLPSDRLAGIVILSDGQVEDVPSAIAAEDFGAPVHVLMTGLKDDLDRRLEVIEAPRFGIVDETVPIAFEVRDSDLDDRDADGAPPQSGARQAMVAVRIDGEDYAQLQVPVGERVEIDVTIAHGGTNVIELEVAPLAGELTERNNRTVIETNGIRDRLRVLLVSGEPHPGERVWRNLLKADPSVDLVHFTILRPPEKHDTTPIDELALIAFPTRELFADKLDSFDLVIFDRYRRRGVLPVSYFANIARYVEDGGALLAATGPEFASPFSLYRSPLAAIFPAQPNGEVLDQGFKPMPTEDGKRHPISAGLAGVDPQDPDWGRIFRLVGADVDAGEVLMEGPNGAPLLVVDRVGEGRVAEIMTDQLWLWSRGYDGGGPQGELLRRLAHWLMKEPDLEEERLSARGEDGRLVIERRTMGDSVPPATVTMPSGETTTLDLTERAPGRFGASMVGNELGLYRVENGDQSVVTAIGEVNPTELRDVRGTEEKLRPLTEATGGGLFWLGDDLALPRVRETRPEARAAGQDWMGLVRNQRYAVMEVNQVPLMSGPIALILMLGALALAWRREAG